MGAGALEPSPAVRHPPAHSRNSGHGVEGKRANSPTAGTGPVTRLRTLNASTASTTSVAVAVRRRDLASRRSVPRNSSVSRAAPRTCDRRSSRSPTVLTRRNAARLRWRPTIRRAFQVQASTRPRAWARRPVTSEHSPSMTVISSASGTMRNSCHAV